MLEFVPVTTGDAEEIMDAWGNDPNNFLYLTSPVLSTKNLAQDYIDSILVQPSSLAFHIYNGEYNIGFVKATVVGHKAQIGYVIANKHWGKGYATKAVHFITLKVSQKNFYSTRLGYLRITKRRFSACIGEMRLRL